MFKKREKSLTINNMKTIQDLRAAKKTLDNKEALRKKHKILIIDDTGYETTILCDLGFIDIKVDLNYSGMDNLHAFDIILCDIDGVYSKEDPLNQGVTLAREIKKRYPNKIVISYSANMHSNDIYTKLNSVGVDYIISKTTNISEMSDLLDECIEKLNDPIKMWGILKKNLEIQGTATKYVALLEHLYVSSLINKSLDYINIDDYKNKLQLSDLIPYIETLGIIVTKFLNEK